MTGLRRLWGKVAAVLLAAFAMGATAAPPPKAVLTIVQEGNSLLAGQTMGVHAWIENPGDAELKDVQIRLAGPQFLMLGRMSGEPAQCAAAGHAAVAVAGSLPAHTAAPVALCVQARQSVEERDVNVGSVLTYSIGTPSRPSAVIVEKKLSVGLLGTDTVAGISLRLTSFFLPGALLLMLLTLAKFPYVDRLSGTNAAIASILISIGLSLMVGWLAANRWVAGLAQETGVSMGALVTAILLAVGLAMVMIVGNLLVMKARALALQSKSAAQRALIVTEGDDERQMLIRALQTAGDDLDPVTVTAGAVTYVGAAAARTASGGVVVLGWYQLEAQDPALRGSLAALISEGDYVGALRHLGPTTLAPSNTLRELASDGTWRPSAAGNVKRVAAKEAPEIARGAVAGLGITDPPLVIGPA